VLGLGDLPGLAQALLDSITEALVGLGVDLPLAYGYDAPIVYVGSGAEPAFDAASTVCNLVSIRQGLPGAEVGGSINIASMTQTATFGIVMLREAAVVGDEGIPGAMTLADEGASIITDASALWRAALLVKHAGSVVRNNEGFGILGVDSVTSEGGLVGNRLLVELSVF